MVELIREDPPVVGGGRGSWIERLLPLMDHPGEWFRITESRHKKGGESTSYALRSGRLRCPPGRWEFTSAWIPDEEVSRAYARYLGDDADPETVIPATVNEVTVITEVPPAAASAEPESQPTEPTEPAPAPSIEGANPPVYDFSAGRPVPVE